MSDSPHPVEQSSPERVPDDIDKKSLPKHVAIVMDGNGRWAKQRGLSRTKGHEQGEQALYDVIYAFLMNFNEKLLLARLEELNEHDVRIRFIGRREKRVPARLLKRMQESEDRTKKNKGMNLCIAFNYGGRAEIVDAVKSIVSKTEGKISEKDITEKSIASNLYCKEMPEVDLVIRSSGEERLSNFLLWQAAYAEFYFTKTLWPEMRREDLFDARRFGAL